MENPDLRPADAEQARPSRRRVVLFLLIPAVLALALLFWLRFNLSAAGQVSVEELDGYPAAKTAAARSYAECWQAVRDFDLVSYRACVDTPAQRAMAKGLEAFYQARYSESDRRFKEVLEHSGAPQDLRARAVRVFGESLLMRGRWMEYKDLLIYLPRLVQQSGLDPDGSVLADAFAGMPPQEIDFPLLGPAQARLTQALTGQPQVRVRIGRRSYDFILDTGASVSCLSSTVAGEIGVQPLGDRSGDVNDIDEIRFYPGLLPSLEVGSLTVRNLPVAIVDAEHLEFGLAGLNLLKVDGILGWPLIRRLRIELDLSQGVARFSPPGDPARERNFFWSGYPMVRLYAEDGTPALFGIDTGAQSSEIRARLIRRMGLQADSDSRIAIGVGRRERVTVQKVEELSLRLGRYRLNFQSIATGEGLYALFFLDPDGQLGFNIAYDTGLTLDFTAGRLELGTGPSTPR